MTEDDFRKEIDSYRSLYQIDLSQDHLAIVDMTSSNDSSNEPVSNPFKGMILNEKTLTSEKKHVYVVLDDGLLYRA